MVDAKKLLPLLRIGAFGSVCVLSFVVLALSAHITSLTSTARFGFYFIFTALAMATAILSLLSLPLMYLISIKRQGAFTSYVAVEIGWCWFLWIMWVASASQTVGVTLGICSGGLCSEAQVISAFSFLNWLTIMGYTVTLLAFAIMMHLRGHTKVWVSEVGSFDWNAPNVKFAQQSLNGGVVQDKFAVGGMVPQQQVIYGQQPQYPPQNVNMGGIATPQLTGQTVYGTPHAVQV